MVGNGKDLWIFDIDETLFSILPYYADHGYGFWQIQGETSKIIGGLLNPYLIYLFLIANKQGTLKAQYEKDAHSLGP
ncbi:hypothetical protein G4B88_008840 [Cannabis sativa]|uniref:Acid phosphatase n=1 Tax=Cannabis sativa TaxID=3483 RepID=A0A7J6FR58_CANSA|nr:hypothetical protein G4B88_008840 [Cannabis sativa]